MSNKITFDIGCITKFIPLFGFILVVSMCLAFNLGDINVIAVGLMSILLAGISLHRLRLKYRFVYGLFEIISALFLGGFTIERSVQFEPMSLGQFLGTSDSLSTILGLSSSIYIVVRGIDNMIEARKANTKNIAAGT